MMLVRIKYLFVVVIFSTKILSAQNEIESAGQWIYDENERTYNWVPSLLKSVNNPIVNLSHFNGYVFNWIPRGQQFKNNTLINGLNWESNLSGWNTAFSYSGMFKIFNYNKIDQNFEYSNDGYTMNNNTSYLSTSSSLVKKGLLVHTGFSNASYINEAHLQYGTGILKNNLSASFFLVYQNAPKGFLPNGPREINGLAFNLEKLYRNNHLFGFTVWWNQANQGIQSPSVLEAYTLSHLRNYNPAWGWLNGQPFYPNNKKNNVPVFSFKYEKNWKDKSMFKINLGVAAGEQSSSQLDWTSTADPRPDYYRYLPSYTKDTGTRNQLIKWFDIHPEYLQINFDKILKINKASLSKRSYYIINSNKMNIFLVRASALYNNQLSNYWDVSAGINLKIDQIHYYNILENLLGGQFYYNYNSWVMDDRQENSFQNNIQNPDQKIKENERWGPDFRLKSLYSDGWVQIKNSNPRWEFSGGLHYGNEFFQRVGYNQNGLFINNSLGASSNFAFPFVGFKGQFLFKYSGRFYVRSIFFNQQYAPNSSAVFLDPNLNSFQTPFLLPQIKKGIDLSLFYRGVNTKIILSAYLQNAQNESEKKFFFHDKYNSFVYGIVGQKTSIYQGFESSIETLLLNFVNLEMSFNVGHYYILNNPLYEILLVNDLYKVESGLLKLKNLPASSSPEITGAISFKIQPSYNSNFTFTCIYAAKRAINYDYFRRSSLLLDSMSNKNLYANIYTVPLLPNQFVFNSSFSKSLEIKFGKVKLPIRCSFSVKNIFNTLIPILVFEQSRFDYNSLNADKFPPKYLYDQGTTYALGIQFLIQ